MRSASRRSAIRSVWLPLVMVALAMIPAASAGAQGLLDFIFGPSKPRATWSPPPARPIEPARRATRDPYEFDRNGADDGTGSYTTYCVRLCDGYFWPMHHKVHRRDFQRDARLCETSCGEDARLFYGPAHSKDSMEGATDLQGKPYSKLPTAFFYRKTLINGCACRPSPWSPAEMARHEDYRIAEEQARRAAEARVAAANAPPPDATPAAATADVGTSETTVSSTTTPRVIETSDPDPNGVALPSRRGAETGRTQNASATQQRAARANEPRQAARPKSTTVAQSAPSKPKPFAFGGGSALTWPGDKAR